MHIPIRTRAPLRISFGGGGTEIDPYRSIYGGEVLSTTVNLYAYSTIEKTRDRHLIQCVSSDLNLSEKSNIEDLLSSELDISKFTLKIHFAAYKKIIDDFNIKNPMSIKITTYCEAPVGSGLGSSSTLSVAIVESLNRFYNLGMAKKDIAHKAYVIERKMLNLSGGLQDHYAATYGGLNYINFYKNGDVRVQPIKIEKSTLYELQASLVLVYTGTSRDSADIIKTQITLKGKELVGYDKKLHEMKVLAQKMKSALLKNDIQSFGYLIDESWQKKRSLSKYISNENINNIYEKTKSLGAYGGKISGAGGGGFLMIICNPNHRAKIINNLISEDFNSYKITLNTAGIKSWILKH